MPEMPQTRYEFLRPCCMAFQANTPSRHYSYECKSVAQDRPYVSRPSRTQQLLNPKLLPKLTSDVSQDLSRKTGVADEQLAKIEQERGRRREQVDEKTDSARKPNGSRSTSPSSSASVATISTNASRSPRKGREAQTQPSRSLLSNKATMETPERKRRRSISSDGSFSSDLEPNRGGSVVASSRSTRRKIGEHSPLTRGRRRSRTTSRSRHTSRSSSSRSPERIRHGKEFERKLRKEAGDTMSSYSTRPGSRPTHRENPDSSIRKQNIRDRSTSPHHRSHQRRTRSREMEESRERAMKPTATRPQRDRNLGSDSRGQRGYDVDERYGTNVKATEHFSGRAAQDRKPFRAPPRERSLSPFSKRQALTQAMNVGR